MAKPRKGKAKVKVTKDGKRVSYGQAGKAKDGGSRVKPGTAKGDAYCARSLAQMKKHPKAAKNPNSPLRLSRKRWKCKGAKSSKYENLMAKLPGLYANIAAKRRRIANGSGEKMRKP